MPVTLQTTEGTTFYFTAQGSSTKLEMDTVSLDLVGGGTTVSYTLASAELEVSGAFVYTFTKTLTEGSWVILVDAVKDSIHYSFRHVINMSF